MSMLKVLPEEELIQFAKTITEVFNVFKEWANVILVKLARFVQVIRNVKPIAKVRHNIVKKIAPRKTVLLDKRTNMYHCRNNC